jgi:toxin-antitoxin system PIN domain toxin
LSSAGFLLDVNVLVALCEEEHIHHQKAMRWFDASAGAGWGICPYSETGFLRLMTNPRVGDHSFEEASTILADLTSLPGFRFWPISHRSSDLIQPFLARIYGHQQIVDAVMFGLALKMQGVFVTLDTAVRYLAGPEFKSHLLVLA